MQKSVMGPLAEFALVCRLALFNKMIWAKAEAIAFQNGHFIMMRHIFEFRASI